MLVVTGNTLICDGRRYRCAIGKGGLSAQKKEGDGATPLGIFPLRECWYRADRMDTPETKLPLRVIHKNDGWCDDPKSKFYNQHIKITPLPNPPPQGGRGYENLWRGEHIYDLIVPIGYNDDPVVPGKGSAIFLHLAHDDYRPTEGCIALAKPDFLAILPAIDTSTTIEIKP
jgi:L,D-peptidoglycan transpeptidase YkuD (ErfK/YbiS/YcfS/YnhG family)